MMVLEEFADKRKKKVKSFALDPYLVDKLDILVKSGEFGSASSIMSIALAEFMSKYDDVVKAKAESVDIEGIIKGYLQSEEGKEFLASVCKTESSSISSEQPAKKVVFE